MTPGSSLIPPYIFTNYQRLYQHLIDAQAGEDGLFAAPERGETVNEYTLFSKLISQLQETMQKPLPSLSEKRVTIEGSSHFTCRMFVFQRPNETEQTAKLLPAEISSFNDLPDLFETTSGESVEIRKDSFANLEHCYTLLQKAGGLLSEMGLHVGEIECAIQHPALGLCGYQTNSPQIVLGASETKVMLRSSFASNLDCLVYGLVYVVLQKRLAAHQREERTFWAAKGQNAAVRIHWMDVLTVAVKQHLHFLNKEKIPFSIEEHNAQADWNIGTNMFQGNIPTNAFHLRSMNAPGSAFENCPFPKWSETDLPEELKIASSDAIDKLRGKWIQGKDLQAAHFEDFAHIEYDHGGMYIFSGILNRAFYLITMALQDYSWKAPLKIWIGAVDLANGSEEFIDFARLTLESGKMYAIFNQKSPMFYEPALVDAWQNVGIFLGGAFAKDDCAGDGASMEDSSRFDVKASGSPWPSTTYQILTRKRLDQQSQFSPSLGSTASLRKKIKDNIQLYTWYSSGIYPFDTYKTLVIRKLGNGNLEATIEAPRTPSISPVTLTADQIYIQEGLMGNEIPLSKIPSRNHSDIFLRINARGWIREKTTNKKPIRLTAIL